ncbi:MAG: family 65 glycosyl hydrolase, partial [Bacteroidota bacterium]
MGKIADRYFAVHPWSVVERGFDPAHGLVSESVFALGNEYQGVRGHFDERYSGRQLIGCYFNGLYEEERAPGSYKGVPTRVRFMVNAANWLYTAIWLDGAELDLAVCEYSRFVRVLDLRRGLLTRSFVWHAPGGRDLEVICSRFVSMPRPGLCYQKMAFRPLNFSGRLLIRAGLDFSVPHDSKGRNYWTCPRAEHDPPQAVMLGETLTSGRRLFSSMRLEEASGLQSIGADRTIGFDFSLPLRQGEITGFAKQVCNYAEKRAGGPVEQIWAEGRRQAAACALLDFDAALREQAAYWERVWEESDLEIQGDPENQQGIRFCLFQMHQAYHGQDPDHNIGAKGLTGEAYNGHTFWDTETYCLPFYLFTNPKAARNLLEFRHKTLPAAKDRARELDCRGAFYPVATLDGTEGCTLWQHANLQLQVGSAVAYAVRHYDLVCADKDFLYGHGFEMLVEICRYYASRGQWGARTGQFGYYGVMGPDEFQLMVNNNCYINFMAK